MKGFFDLLVTDEVHEYKGRGSAQGIAAGILADVCGKSLSLTGTLMGGYASTLFHLLYRFSPEIRTEFGRSEEHRWIKRYGFEECTMGKPDDDAIEDGRNSRRRKYRKVVRERPGLVPSALFHLIGNTVFLRLADVASGLPDYTEQVMLSSMDSEEDSTGYSQRSAYNTVFEELRRKLADALSKGSKRLLSTYLQTLLAYPDGCTRGETVFDPESGDVIVQVPPLSEERLYPKEKALVDLVAKERMEGRRVLVYVTHTGTRDITGRMDDILTRHGFRVAVMKADAVAPDQEGGLGRRQGEAGHRRAHLPSQAGPDGPRPDRLPDPLLVRDGLQCLRHEAGVAAVVAHRADPPGEGGVHVLPEHPAGRRPEAGGQEAAKLPGRRGGAAGGRAGAYGDDGDDLMMALARKIVSGDEDETETVEEIFAQARNAEVTAEELSGGRRLEGRRDRTGDGLGQRQRKPRQRKRRQRTPHGWHRADGETWSWTTGTMPMGTVTMRRQTRRSSLCSPGRSSWPWSW